MLLEEIMSETTHNELRLLGSKTKAPLSFSACGQFISHPNLSTTYVGSMKTYLL